MMKPVLQMLAIELEKLPRWKHNALVTGPAALQALIKAKGGDVEKAKERLARMREHEVELLYFTPMLQNDSVRQSNNRRAGQTELHQFFSKKA